MKSIRCVIRNIAVEAHPEELIRQKLLCRMIGPLGYPKHLITAEKSLKHMPHLMLNNQEIPERRIDIVCFAKGIHAKHALYPLLLVECKAVRLTPKVINQVTGYNHYLKSYFIAITNKEEIQTGWYDGKKQQWQFVPYLPSFLDLIQAVNSPASP